MGAQIRRLKNDSRSIHEAAKTISLAFAHDPLIEWLRPGARSWGELDSVSMKWQQRRVARFNCDHVVLRLPLLPLSDFRMTSRDANAKPPQVVLTEDKSDDFAAIAMLECPSEPRGPVLGRICLRMKLWLLDIINPVTDPGGKESRIQKMMEVHDAKMHALNRRLGERKPWYIEVVAVKPEFHGRGLGGRMLTAIIEMAGSNPLVLECTDVSNIGFYKRYGFEEVEHVTLNDGKSVSNDTISYCLMLRRGQNTSKID